MSEATATADDTETTVVDLKNPTVAAVLAWLWPGAGHFYQGRFAKGVVFLVCILGTFGYGMMLGEGRVVYLGEGEGGGGGWRRLVGRMPYLCQVWVGLPALPAVARSKSMGDPDQSPSHWSNWYVPPRSPVELDALHKRLHRYFELGTVYTMIAGLLNVLAIFDAWGGPAYSSEKRDDADNDDETAQPAAE